MSEHRKHFPRFIVNGVLATLVHFGFLTLFVEINLTASAGVSNACASVFGILASYLGNRYWVFSERRASQNSLWKFLVVYSGMVLVHGLVLWLWTDIANLDYRLGFIVATAIHVILTYLGNFYFTFKHHN